MAAILHICTTCRAGQAVTEGEDTPGTKLHRAITEQNIPEGVEIREVKCLSACSKGCAVALTAPGKWGYVYGEMDVDCVPDILAGATAYAAASDGIVPWRERPEIFRKRGIARMPPLED